MKQIGKVTHIKSMKIKKPTEQLTLYSVNTLRMKDRCGPKWGGDRCVAICSTADRAKEMVENNEGDLYEDGYYQYAVVEALLSDEVYAGCIDEQYWYEWSSEEDSYVALDEAPEQFSRTINFGVG